MSTLYIVVPCYNEEEVLPDTNQKLLKKLDEMIAAGRIDDKSRICYVDDGSKDKTWEIISDYHNKYEKVCGVKLAHNRGHQGALLCGLMTVKDCCDCTVSIDADLQDDIDVMDEFMDKFNNEGCEIVYGVRKKRTTDTFFKRFTAEGFYKILNALGVECVFNHADYRLMSSTALDALSEYKEVNLFLRGMVPHIGYKTDCAYYDRSERLAGESKYPLKKMLALAFDGITSFSVKPLTFITTVGMAVSAISFFVLLILIILQLVGAAAIGWIGILVVSLWFLGGIQLLGIGIVGEYIGKIYSETKARPRFRVEKFLNR